MSELQDKIIEILNEEIKAKTDWYTNEMVVAGIPSAAERITEMVANALNEKLKAEIESTDCPYCLSELFCRECGRLVGRDEAEKLKAELDACRGVLEDTLSGVVK